MASSSNNKKVTFSHHYLLQPWQWILCPNVCSCQCTVFPFGGEGMNFNASNGEFQKFFSLSCPRIESFSFHQHPKFRTSQPADLPFSKRSPSFPIRSGLGQPRETFEIQIARGLRKRKEGRLLFLSPPLSPFSPFTFYCLHKKARTDSACPLPYVNQTFWEANEISSPRDISICMRRK